LKFDLINENNQEASYAKLGKSLPKSEKARKGVNSKGEEHTRLKLQGGFGEKKRRTRRKDGGIKKGAKR